MNGTGALGFFEAMGTGSVVVILGGMIAIYTRFIRIEERVRALQEQVSTIHRNMFRKAVIGYDNVSAFDPDRKERED